jgi:hypothetical protein
MEGIKGRTCALGFVKVKACEWYFIHKSVMKNMQKHKQAVIFLGKGRLFIPLF